MGSVTLFGYDRLGRQVKTVRAASQPSYDLGLDPSLSFYNASDAPDTDFTGKLCDVYPDGRSINLCEGILRARYRNSQEKPEFLNPGEVYKLTIDLWATSNVFLAGHKLRLEVSSSNFPRFDRNLNTGEDQARATHWVKATNAIYHDREHPSTLVVPVVPQ